MQKEVQKNSETSQNRPIARESKGQFKKGVSPNPKGRGKGVASKKVALVKGFTDHMLAGGADKFKRELNKLKGRDYVHAYMTLMEFSIPKKARVEHTSDGETFKVTQVFMIGGKEITL